MEMYTTTWIVCCLSLSLCLLFNWTDTVIGFGFNSVLCCDFSFSLCIHFLYMSELLPLTQTQLESKWESSFTSVILCAWNHDVNDVKLMLESHLSIISSFISCVKNSNQICCEKITFFCSFVGSLTIMKVCWIEKNLYWGENTCKMLFFST